MRWDLLFADLEGQLEAAAGDALDADIADRTRREVAQTTLEGRLRGVSGLVVELSVAGIGPIVGEARSVGPGWVMLQVAGAMPAVVATRHVYGARDLPVMARELAGADESSQAGLAQVLRVLARDRTVMVIVLADGATVTGTVDRVGTDYLDLAEHSLDEPRRATLIRGIRTIALSAVAVVRPRLE